MNELKEYFKFSRREFIGILCLCIIILFLSVLPIFFTDSPGPVVSYLSVKENREKLNQLLETPNAEEISIKPKTEPSIAKIRLEKFDPNTVSKEYWESIGLKEKTAGIIVNYVSKGGKFRKAEDLQKIYSLDKKDYLRLKDFIQIEQKSFEAKTDVSSISYDPASKKPMSFSRPAISVVEINTADSSALEALPGIGSKLSSRIIKFRDKLGGFYSVNQVAELYGLADSVFQKIKPYLLCSGGSVKKIKINELGEEDLSKHPYIGRKFARVIIKFRELHGHFEGIEKLNDVQVLDSVTIRKLGPYLEF